MSFASAADLVLASSTDIQQALLKPPPGLHFPSNHVSALKQLNKVIISITMSDNEHTLSPKNDAPLRVDSLHPIATSIEVDTPPLRVVTSPLVLSSPVKPCHCLTKGTLCSFSIGNDAAYLT
jgi:hypothetical protein